MRIKAVLRDSEILKLTLGSRERIITSATKNIDRLINLPSLLKVMGLTFDDRCKMLGILKEMNIHIWLMNDVDQHLIFLSENKDAEEAIGYQWQ